MEQLASKISAYHILSYMLTGLSLAVSYDIFHPINVSDSLLIQLGLVYVVGLAASRVGSIFLEWFLKSVRFVKYADYADYVKADNADTKVSGLAEQSAFYRTLATGYLLLFFISMFDGLRPITVPVPGYVETFAYLGLSILFLLSYRKQSYFVFKRVSAHR